MSSSPSSTALEMTLLMSVAGASTLINFMSQDRLPVVVARRIFTILNLLMAVVVSFSVDVPHVWRYVVAVLGPMFINAVLSALSHYLPRDDGGVQKRAA